MGIVPVLFCCINSVRTVAVLVLDDFLKEFGARRAALEAVLVGDEVCEPVRLGLEESREAGDFESPGVDGDVRKVHEFRRQLLEIGLQCHEEFFALQSPHIEVSVDGRCERAARALLPLLENE